MYSLTFRVRVTTPAVWTKWNGARSRRVDFIAGEGSLRRHAYGAWHCVRRAVGLGDYRWALPRISSVAIATQPVHRLQIRPIAHNYGASPTTPPSYIRVRAIVRACGRGQTHTQTRVTTIHFASSTTHAKCNYCA